MIERKDPRVYNACKADLHEDIVMLYRDKEGNEISLLKYANLFSDIDYRRIKRDVINGKLVSTVWLGIQHPGGLFETMVFCGDEERYCERYETLQEAIEGHENVCKRMARKEHLALQEN